MRIVVDVDRTRSVEVMTSKELNKSVEVIMSSELTIWVEVARASELLITSIVDVVSNVDVYVEVVARVNT